MKKLITLLFVIPAMAFAQKAKVVKFEAFQKLIETKSDQIQVINFWATWCGPCVKELPWLEKLHSENLSNIKVTLISLDFADKVDKVNSFLNHKAMKAEVLLLDEIDYNSWIDKVDKNWSGTIPATLVINSNTGKRKFIEKELKEGDLEKLIHEVE